jgi:hypothetical protein
MDSTHAEWKNSDESLVRDTAGGEMPDTSKSGEMKRRLEADSAILRSRLAQPAVLIPLMTGFLGVGVYFLWQAFRKDHQSNEMDENLSLELG